MTNKQPSKQGLASKSSSTKGSKQQPLPEVCNCSYPTLNPYIAGECLKCAGLFADNRVLKWSASKEVTDYYMSVHHLSVEQFHQCIKDANTAVKKRRITL